MSEGKKQLWRELIDECPLPLTTSTSLPLRLDSDTVERNDDQSHYADNFDRDAMSQDRARSRSPVAGGAPSSDRRDSHRDRSDRSDRPPRNFHDRAIASQHAAHEASRKSQKNCRVYVGNLNYGVKWNTLKDFMREGG